MGLQHFQCQINALHFLGLKNHCISIHYNSISIFFILTLIWHKKCDEKRLVVNDYSAESVLFSTVFPVEGFMRFIPASFLYPVVLGLLTTSITAHAHHAFSAEYDAEKPFEVKGKLTKMEWINPHSFIYVDKVADDGTVTNWKVEFGGPNALLRRGLRKSDFPLGVEVNINGYLAKSGKSALIASTVLLPDGRSLYAGSEGTGAPGDPSAARQ
jgi:hypothetical protein